jgi:hypothetical protein
MFVPFATGFTTRQKATQKEVLFPVHLLKKYPMIGFAHCVEWVRKILKSMKNKK